MKGTKAEQRPGVWRLRVVDGYDDRGRPHQLSKTVKGTKKMADTALAAFVADVERGIAPTSGGMTFADYLGNRWLPHVEATREPTTHEVHAGKVKRWIIPTLGRVPLAKLTAAHLDAAYRAWEQTLSPASVVATAATVSAALEQACRWGLLSRNVARLATAPRQSRRVPTMPTIEQVVELIETAEREDPTLSVCIALAATTGLRRGELAGLRWGDVDTETCTLNVRWAVKRVSGRSIVGDPKTHRSRVISIDPTTLELLALHRGRQATVGKAGDEDFLFTWRTEHDKPVNPDALTMRFNRLAKQVGVGCRLHDLRHAVASHMLSQGVDLAVVARRLGHATPAITLKIYAHAVAEADRQAASVMPALLAASASSR